jgi:hypothetical protein
MNRRSATIATFALSYAVSCATCERVTQQKTGLNHAVGCAVAGISGGVPVGRLLHGGLVGAGLGLATAPLYWYLTVHLDYPSMLQGIELVLRRAKSRSSETGSK